jgi:hypothetical protein
MPRRARSAALLLRHRRPSSRKRYRHDRNLGRRLRLDLVFLELHQLQLELVEQRAAFSRLAEPQHGLRPKICGTESRTLHRGPERPL